MIRNVLTPVGTLNSDPTVTSSRFNLGLPIYTDWSTRPDGPLVDMVTRGDDGIPANLSTINNQNVTALVSDGALTWDHSAVTSGTAAVYVNFKLDRTIKRIGATLAFDGADTGDGALCLATWNHDEAIPDTALRAQIHFNILPSSWTFDVIDGPNTFRHVGGETYSTPLPTDGSRLTVEITIDGDTATIYHPNGTISQITDPQIGAIEGYTACWEFYANGQNPVPIKLYETWADDRPARFGQPTLAQVAGSGGASAPSSSASVVNPDIPPKAMWPWYRALGNRYFAPADIFVLGDSISEGGSVTDLEYRWLHRLRDLLRNKYPTPGVVGGQGFISSHFIAATFPHGWNYGGNLGPADTFGFGLRGVRLSSPDGYIARQVTATDVRIYFAKSSGAGTFSYVIDGGAPTTVNTAGTANAAGYVDIHLSDAGAAHNIELIWSSGGDIIIGGFMLMNGDKNAGIRVIDASHWGIKAADYGSETGAAGLVQQWVSAVKPGLTIVALGGNDYFGNIAPADFRADIEYIVSQIKAATTDKPTAILLLGEYKLYATQTYDWPAYRDELASIAAADPDNVAFVDLYPRWPAGDGVDHLDVLDADNTHPNNAGHAMFADYIVDFVSPY